LANRLSALPWNIPLTPSIAQQADGPDAEERESVRLGDGTGTGLVAVLKVIDFDAAANADARVYVDGLDPP
jgi:hypothetical protein